MSNRLDHFMYAGADLAHLVAAFKDLSGVEAGYGGTHPGLGTCNALASLGTDTYLELIAPDPAQKLAGTYGEPISVLKRPQVYAYVVRAPNLNDIQRLLRDAGIESNLIDASRVQPGGAVLRWRLLLPQANPFGEHLPKFIDWKDTKHPAVTSTAGCSFESFEVGHPHSESLSRLLDRLGVSVPVLRSDCAYFRAKIGTPKGSVVLTGLSE